MQRDYECAKKLAVVNAVVRQIADARTRGAGIVVVAIKGFGPTLPRIKDALKGYEKVSYTTKKGRDGSLCVWRRSWERDFNYMSFIVCGVYIDECVAMTVRGLLKRGLRVQVIRAACNSIMGQGAGIWWDFQEVVKSLISPPQIKKQLKVA